jgi:4'-phosphopantetheinyl transferase
MQGPHCIAPTPILGPEEVLVYDVDLAPGTARTDDLMSILDERERERALRFVTAELTRKYVVSHAMTRWGLARHLGIAPQGVSFVQGDHGKPSLSPRHESRLEFNISHSGDRCLIALGEVQMLGVDVERIRPLENWMDIAERFFAPRETEQLSVLPPNLVGAAFFGTWASKEAYIKALGLGLALNLASFEVEVDPNREAGLLWTLDANEGPAYWSMRRIEVGSRYRATLAVRGHCRQVHRIAVTTESFAP